MGLSIFFHYERIRPNHALFFSLSSELITLTQLALKAGVRCPLLYVTQAMKFKRDTDELEVS